MQLEDLHPQRLGFQLRYVTRLGDNRCAVVSAANQSGADNALIFDLVKQMMIDHIYAFMLERQSDANCSALLGEFKRFVDLIEGEGVGHNLVERIFFLRPL